MNGRLVRKTLSFSKQVAMLRATCIWEDAVYNLAHRLKTLQIEVNQADQRGAQRSPAMVAGLTDHIGSIREILTCLPIPTNSL
jgi:hypothetical protein